MGLGNAIKAAMFPTPRANDSKNGAYTYDRGDHGAPRLTLTGLARLGMTTRKGLWPTPRTKGMCGGTGNWAQLKAKCEDITEARQMGAGNGGQLNPTWVEWLMGYPLGWTDLSALEIALCLK